MLNAQKRFINDMKNETEAYMYNLSSMIPDFSKECADALMNLYPDTAAKAVQHMTLIACEKYPEAFSLFVISNACSQFLLDTKNNNFLLAGAELTPAGKAIMDMYQLVLKKIASDPSTPSGQHNTMQLEFVKQQLAARMK